MMYEKELTPEEKETLKECMQKILKLYENHGQSIHGRVVFEDRAFRLDFDRDRQYEEFIGL